MSMNRADFMLETKQQVYSARKEKSNLYGEQFTFNPKLGKKTEDILKNRQTGNIHEHLVKKGEESKQIKEQLI